MELENWMGGLPESKKITPLIYIAIPGSHDSLSYSIEADAPVAPDAEPIVRTLIKFFGPILRKIIRNWCVTQSASVVEQLHCGIRYFDFRLAPKPHDPNIYFVHGLYGDPIFIALAEIETFLNNHPEEVVILDFQHFYAFSNNDHTRMIGLLESTFGSRLCPLPRDVNDVTIAWMLNNGYRVIVIYRDAIALTKKTLWHSNAWPTPWPETMSIDFLLNYLSSRLVKRPSNAGYVSQCLLTPTNWTVICRPWSSVHSRCAKPVAKAILPWIKDQPSGRLNVAIADFVSDQGALFPSTVVNHNYH